MNEDELMTTEALDDVAPLLPDGWTENDDIFDEAAWSGKANTEPAAEETSGTAEETEAPTTGEAESEASQSAEENPPEEPSGQTETPMESTPKKYIISGVVVNHAPPKNVELTEEEIRVAVQKAEAFDRKVEQQRKATYRETYQKQIDSGMTEEIARIVAEKAADGHTYALTDEEEAAQLENPAEDNSAKPGDDVQDLASEIESFYQLYPKEREKPVPDEVAMDVAAGANFTRRYLAYMNKRDEAAAKSLKKENEVLKQNAASAARAPVRGVTGGGPTETKPESDFLRGFNSDGW